MSLGSAAQGRPRADVASGLKGFHGGAIEVGVRMARQSPSGTRCGSAERPPGPRATVAPVETVTITGTWEGTRTEVRLIDVAGVWVPEGDPDVLRGAREALEADAIDGLGYRFPAPPEPVRFEEPLGFAHAVCTVMVDAQVEGIDIGDVEDGVVY